MLTLPALEQFLTQIGQQKYRAHQIMHAMYKEWNADFTTMTAIPAELRGILAVAQKEEKIQTTTVQLVKIAKSKNGDTEKALFRMKDGKYIEAVLMRFADGRHSICISSQAGCPLKCSFCATGEAGFFRNLTAEEMCDQIYYFAAKLAQETPSQHITNIVYMGMGEPFLNYDAVMQSVRYLNDPLYFNIGARHITLSTSGIVPSIQQLADEKLQVNLAVSLHAPNQKLRVELMPIARRFQLPELMETIEEYIHKTHRRVSYEYVMLDGVNDSAALGHELGKLIKGQLCHVNLIPYNWTSIKGLTCSPMPRIHAFQKIVKSYGVSVTIRHNMGQDIAAACGQLAGQKQKESLKKLAVI